MYINTLCHLHRSKILCCVWWGERNGVTKKNVHDRRGREAFEKKLVPGIKLIFMRFKKKSSIRRNEAFIYKLGVCSLAQSAYRMK